MTSASAKVMQRSNPVFDLDNCSSKIAKIVEITARIVSSTSDELIIVSQWTNFVRIVRGPLAKRNICTVVIDGTVPVKNRQGIVDDFNNPIIGGVGLNLIGANHLLLLDWHWNPQLESQAQDRIYRVGQKKTVQIYKFMCADTIEERIKALQDNKLALASGFLDGTSVAKGSKLSLNDLKGLFEM